MNIKNTLTKITAISVVIFSFVACDHDYETIGSNIVGTPGFDADLYEEAQISFQNVDLGPVQTNNLPLYLLGVYESGVYGTQTANILTQLSLSATSPSFGTGAVIDSVILSIPYFHTELETEDDGSKTYELDSVYGSSPIKLSVIQSNLFLNQYDPETDFENAQKYFSDLQPQIESNLGLNVLFESESFLPSPNEIVEYGLDDEGKKDTVALTPRMRLRLSKEFFQSNIIDMEGSPELSTNNNFSNFLRGIYFKTESIDGDGNMMLLNLADAEAGITLYYTSKVADSKDVDEDDDRTELIDQSSSFKLNFGPTKVNTFEQEVPEIDSENIYLKGGEGVMAVIELFSGPDSDGDGVSDELEFLRESDWLINEANLIFYVNQEILNSTNEPEHLYLYDFDNDIVLADYQFERSGEANAATSLVNLDHLGPLEKDEAENGLSYKIRLTNHIYNVINKDSTNVKLGLVVSQNINIISHSAVKGTAEIERIPSSSVISPEGTVLYGPQSENEEKRLKLRIYYSEPKE
ncbi:MAG TPA: DUF4270 domain-containing protein [Salinimicrobium sp.]|nr:DUF4270 domain-containing protein [Salinimicrobium sp.]